MKIKKFVKTNGWNIWQDIVHAIQKKWNIVKNLDVLVSLWPTYRKVKQLVLVGQVMNKFCIHQKLAKTPICNNWAITVAHFLKCLIENLTYWTTLTLLSITLKSPSSVFLYMYVIPGWKLYKYFHPALITDFYHYPIKPLPVTGRRASCNFLLWSYTKCYCPTLLLLSWKFFTNAVGHKNSIVF